MLIQNICHKHFDQTLHSAHQLSRLIFLRLGQQSFGFFSFMYIYLTVVSFINSVHTSPAWMQVNPKAWDLEGRYTLFVVYISHLFLFFALTNHKENGRNSEDVNQPESYGIHHNTYGFSLIFVSTVHK